jgi:hypothetical protein
MPGEAPRAPGCPILTGSRHGSGLAATRPDVLATLCRVLNAAISLHYRT